MSKKELSRRDFLKGAAGAAGVAAIGMLAGCGGKPEPTPTPEQKSEGIYTPGTYTAKGQGLSTLLVTMTFSADAITDVVLDLSGETPNIGQIHADELREAILAAQSGEIDTIASATLTSQGVAEAAKKCIQQAKGEIPIEVIGGESAEAGKNWLGTEPETADISETWDTDLLIVGAGNAGMAAAAYAASKKLNFRVIEKMDSVNKTRSWYGAVDTKDMLAAGEKMDRAKLRREIQKFSSGKVNMRAINTWIEESAAMHEFIGTIYAKYYPDATVDACVGEEARWPAQDDSGYFFPPIQHYWQVKDGIPRNEMLQKYMEEEGYSIDFKMSIVKLEKQDGKVTGVIAQNTGSGKYIRINASKGVIIATGGYPGNPEMMEQLDPLGTAVTTTNVCSPQDTGEGIKAAMWAGAVMQGEPAPVLFDRGMVAPGVDAGYVTTSTGAKVFPGTEGQFNLGTQPFLKVNRRGQRFTNESGPYDNMPYAAYNQPGKVYAQIFDAGMPEDVQRFHTIGCSVTTRMNPQRQLDIFEEKIEKGLAFKADTLEELADKLGFVGEDKETFLATCARYNELYDMQEDVDFGKPAYRLSALRTAPFYGYWLGACLLTTNQGVLVDENARVLDEGRRPMEGLYAAGDATGGFYVNNYPCLMGGFDCGKAMTFAIKAVKVASGIDE